MGELVVACVWLQGNVPYTAEYVTNLYQMVQKWLSVRHHFLVLTDQYGAGVLDTSGRDSMKVQVVPNLCPERAWWNKLHLFNPEIVSEGYRMLYLDLDVIVLSDLTELLDYHERNDQPMTLIPHEGNFKGRKGLRVIPCYNSSCMVWDSGTMDHLYTDHSQKIIDTLWGDQDWIAKNHDDLGKFPIEWFPRISSLKESFDSDGDAGFPLEARIILAKKPKPHEAVKQWPFLQQTWEGA